MRRRVFTGFWGLRQSIWAVMLCLFAVLLLGAGQQDDSARYNRLGHNMICTCGCGQILLECNHVGCQDSAQMIGELKDQIAGPNGAGADSLILNWFAAKYGATVLAAPMRGGFDLVAWIVPLAVFVLATIGTALLVRMWTQRTRGLPAGAGAVGLAAPHHDLHDSVLARIRRDTEYR